MLIKPEGDWLAVVADAVHAGDVICLPTDTVYGVGADPFSTDAVTNLLTAKSRTRQKPPPVLVTGIEQARTLVSWVPDEALRLAEAYWPGALTLILPVRDEIGWDLGETNGTVALRMPDNAVALEILRELGPLAVTSANKTGQPPAQTAGAAQAQLGDAVRVYIDAGEVGGGVPSTILRFSPAESGKAPRVDDGAEPGETDAAVRIELIRAGAIPVAELERVAGSVIE